MTRTEVVERIRRALEARTDVRLAVLFGSRARGTAGPDSDVDLAVDAPGVDTVELAVSLSEVVGQDVDIVSVYADSIPLLHAIVRDGALVHEACRGAGAAWRSWALLTLETDLPWFRHMADAARIRLARAAPPGAARGEHG